MGLTFQKDPKTTITCKTIVTAETASLLTTSMVCPLVDSTACMVSNSYYKIPNMASECIMCKCSKSGGEEAVQAGIGMSQ